MVKFNISSNIYVKFVRNKGFFILSIIFPNTNTAYVLISVFEFFIHE